MIRYPWPGNIRELRNAIERGVILSPGPLIELDHLPTQIGNPIVTGASSSNGTSLEEIEAEHIRQVLASTATIEEAATRLGIRSWTLATAILHRFRGGNLRSRSSRRRRRR